MKPTAAPPWHARKGHAVAGALLGPYSLATSSRLAGEPHHSATCGRASHSHSSGKSASTSGRNVNGVSGMPVLSGSAVARLARRDSLDGANVGLGELEVECAEVLVHVRRAGGAGERDHPDLEREAKDHL